MSDSLQAHQLAPRLKANVDMFRHVYRGEVWYVFHDRARDAYYRLSAAAAAVIGALDGKRTLGELRDDMAAREGAAADSQDLLQFAGRMNALGLLQSGTPPRPEAIERSQAANRQRKFWSTLKNPLAVKVPLFDPSPALNRLEWCAPFLFGSFGLLLWSLALAVGVIFAALHWTELTGNLLDRMFSLQNLAVAWLVYPAIKVIHEFAHALALRRCGGEVRRMGIIFVAFIPIPYVDASASSTFANKRWRILVASAGIMAELLLCAVALMIWAAVEPGLIRTICFNVVMITGISTLLFNGNPLQRYDGYYIFSDLIEIPDLGPRSAQYIQYVMRRLLLADSTARPPRASKEELRWFRAYGPASALYRTFLVLSIIVYVATQYPVFGVVLAVWAIGGLLWTPAAALFRVARDPDRSRRARAARRLGFVALVAGIVLFVLPAPHRAVVQGFFWLPEESNARAAAPGELVALMLKPGDTVRAGDAIAELANNAVKQRVIKAAARLTELDATFTQAFAIDRVQAAIIADKIEQARHELAEAERDQRNLVVRSPAAGKLIVPFYVDVDGRFFTRGQLVATVWDGSTPIVRVLVPLWQIDLVRSRTKAVAIKPTYDISATLPGHVLRIVPSATDILPSPVLSIDGGGPFAVTKDGENLRTSEAMFVVDVAVDGGIAADFLNGRAHVRFDLGWEPIGIQLYRSVRLAFLRHFYA